MNRESLLQIIKEEIQQAIDSDGTNEDSWKESQIFQHAVNKKSDKVFITNTENMTHYQIQFDRRPDGKIIALITQVSMRPVSKPKVVLDPKQFVGMENAGRFSIDYPK